MSNFHSTFRARLGWLALVAALVSFGAHAAPASADDPDMQRVSQFRLDGQVMAKYIKAQQALMRAAKAHPELKSQEEEQDDDKTLGEMVARVNKQPVMRAAIASAGMNATDYVLCGLALLQSGLYAAGVQMQGEKAWARIPAGIPTENTRWVIAHQAELKQLQASDEAGGD